MTSMGMTQSNAEPCLFHGLGVDIIVYVDDILIVAKHQKVIDGLKCKVMTAFKSTDVGPPTFFLGLHIKCDPETRYITVSQQQYVKSLLARSRMEDANAVRLPMAVGVQLQKSGKPLDEAGLEDYQVLIGGLLYLASCTRPGISFAVGKRARYGSAPTAAHQAAAKTVLRYLRGTINWGLIYGATSSLTGYTDAHYTGDVDTRSSTKGYAFMLNGGAISWQSKVQPTVATSTTEAEYIAAAQGAREAVWLKLLIKDITGIDKAVTLRCDNQSAIKLIDNPAGTARSKHIDVAHHFVRDMAARGDLEMYVPTTAMTADVMTKALPRALLTTCIAGLGMVNTEHHVGLKGSVERDEDTKSPPDKSRPRGDSLLTPCGGADNSAASPSAEATATRATCANGADQKNGGVTDMAADPHVGTVDPLGCCLLQGDGLSNNDNGGPPGEANGVRTGEAPCPDPTA